MPPPAIQPSQSVCLSVLQGNFFGGGELVNQLEKIAIAVDRTCSAKSNSGSDENHQSAAALQQHVQILSGDSNKFHSIKGRSHLSFCEGVVS